MDVEGRGTFKSRENGSFLLQMLACMRGHFKNQRDILSCNTVQRTHNLENPPKKMF